MWCAMSEYDDNTNEQEDYVHTHLSSVAFHVHCVGLGWCRTSHRSVSPRTRNSKFLVRLYLVIVNSDCSHNENGSFEVLSLQSTHTCPYSCTWWLKVQDSSSDGSVSVARRLEFLVSSKTTLIPHGHMFVSALSDTHSLHISFHIHFSSTSTTPSASA